MPAKSALLARLGMVIALLAANVVLLRELQAKGRYAVGRKRNFCWSFLVRQNS